MQNRNKCDKSQTHTVSASIPEEAKESKKASNRSENKITPKLPTYIDWKAWVANLRTAAELEGVFAGKCAGMAVRV